MKIKILSYIRPATKKQYSFFVQNLTKKENIIYCSEHFSVDQTGLPHLYYSFLKKKNTLKNINLSSKDVDDFILRCRLLRNIKRSEALKHLIAMYMAIDKILLKEKPTHVTFQTVDSYITDLIRLISKRRKIKCICVVGTFVNNHFRISSRGEKTLNKKKNKYISKLLPKFLKESYIPDYSKNSIRKPLLTKYKQWFRNLVGSFYFPIKRYLSNDFYNYHYWHNEIICKQYLSFFPPGDLGDINWEMKLKYKKKPSLYIPLQKYPEATIDYWCEDLELVKYYEFLEKLIKKLHKHFSLFIKEHPDVIAFRPKSFYSKITKDKRITLIPTNINSNSIINKIDGVVIWTGTVGFDSLIRGKAVFGLATPFFANGKRFMKINLKTKIKKMIDHLNYCKKNKILNSEQRKSFDFVAKQLYKGKYKFHKEWSSSNSTDINDIKQMAKSCKHLFKV